MRHRRIGISSRYTALVTNESVGGEPVSLEPKSLEPMTRVGFTLQVRAERLDEYRALHQQVWPEMLAALTAAGWRNYSLFVRPDGLLFGYLETPGTFEEAQVKMAGLEVNARWQRLTAPFFKLPGDTKADEAMTALECVFYLP